MFAILAVCMAFSASCIAQPKVPSSCSPSGYLGLIVGKSTGNDVVKALGKPEAIAREEDSGVPYWSYTVTDPAPGWLMVFTRKGVLTGIRLILKTSLSRADIVHLYGADILTVHYAFDDCLGNGGAGPVYVSPGGPIEKWEYRGKGKGIVISVHDGQAQEIVFECGPAGPLYSRCASPAHASHIPKP